MTWRTAESLARSFGKLVAANSHFSDYRESEPKQSLRQMTYSVKARSESKNTVRMRPNPKHAKLVVALRIPKPA